MTQNKFLTTFGILSLLVLSFTFANALQVSPSTISFSGNPGSSNSTTFTLFNEDTVNSLTNINFAFSNLALSGSSSSISNSNINSIAAISSLPNSTNSVSQTLTITIPSGSTAGTYLGTMNVTGNSNGSSVTFTTPISLQVNQAPSLSLSISTALTKTQNGTVTVTNNGNTALSSISLSQSGDFSVGFNITNPFSLVAGASKTVGMFFTNSPASFQTGSVTILANDSSGASASTSFNIKDIKFCANGTIGNLTISDFSTTNLGSGSDTDWNPLDNVKIDVTVSNNGDSSISGVNLKILVLDSNGNDVTSKFSFTNTRIDIGSISSNSDQTGTFEIASLPSNIDEATYQVYIKAYKSGSESSTCSDKINGDLSEQISVSRQFDQAVVVKPNELTNIQASCGDTINMAFDVYNIGTDKESSVLVQVFNQDLGLSQSQVVSSLPKNGKQTVDFTIPLSTNLTKSKYPILITTYFDYRGGQRDVYDPISYNKNSHSDLDESYSQTLLVSNCQASTVKPTITATLASDAQVGKDLVVSVTVNNPFNMTSYVITPVSFDSWAKLVSVQPQTLTVNAVSSGQATVTLNPTQAGTQTFTIRSIYNGQVVDQPVTVTVQASTNVLSQLSNLGSSSLYIIAAVILVLIIIVIVLIVKVSGRKKSDF